MTTTTTTTMKKKKPETVLLSELDISNQDAQIQTINLLNIRIKSLEEIVDILEGSIAEKEKSAQNALLLKRFEQASFPI